MISYMMVKNIESLQAIIKEIQHDLYKFDLKVTNDLEQKVIDQN